MSSNESKSRQSWITLSAILGAALTIAACSSGGGKGKMSNDLKPLPTGLIADTANAKHTGEILKGEN